MKTLERTLGLPYVVAISIAAMLGSGIFVLPGIASASTGPSIWLAYLFAGLCVLPAALSKSELATAMPTSGGTYVYVDRAFGPMAGTIAGLGLWLALALKSAFALMGFGAYMAIIVDVPMQPVALCFLVAIIALNVVGVRQASRVLVVVVVLALCSLAILVVAGGFVEPTAPQPFFKEGGGGFLAATAYVFMSYAGVTKVAAVAEEVRDPVRNLPRGTLISLFLVALVYSLVVSTLVNLLPPGELTQNTRPVHTLAVRVFGGGPAIAFAVLGVLTMASMANAGVLAASRFPFAMARNNLLPPLLSRIHPRFLTPAPSIFFTGVAMAVAITTLDIERIAKLASGITISVFAVVNLAVIVLRESDAPWYKPGFRSPLYPLVQIFGILTSILLLFALGWVSLAGVIAAVIPGAALYLAYGRQQVERRGQLTKVGKRKDLVSPPSSPSNPSLTPDSDGVTGEAAVVVLLVGRERSPEVLVEIGAALADGRVVEVVHITELPEQTALGVMVADDPPVRALRRRAESMAAEKGIDLKFDAVVTHDVVETAYSLANRLHCEWLVMEWRGRGRNRFLFLSPLGWLLNHLPCKLALFKDEGVRYFRHILVDAEPGPDDSLVVSTADHLAELEGAELTFVRHVPTDAPEMLLQGQADYIDQLRDLCASPTHSLIVRGGQHAEAVGDVAALYDLLITSAPPGAGAFWDIFRPSQKDLLKERAASSVLSLKNPRVLSSGAHRGSVTGAFQRDGYLDPMEYVDIACLGARLQLTRKEALFQHFAGAFSKSVPGVSAEEIADKLWERERAQNTSVGVALPHATIPRSARPRIGVFTTARPVDWGAPDGVDVDVFFVTLGPPSERQTHLLILSTIATLVLKSSLLDRLRVSETNDDLLQAIKDSAAALRS